MTRLIDIPQPSNVDMRVSDGVGNGLGLDVFKGLIVVFAHKIARGLDGSVESVGIGHAKIE